MSITIAQRAARLAEMPMFCASCGSQDPGARYVDFDAAQRNGRLPDLPQGA